MYATIKSYDKDVNTFSLPRSRGCPCLCSRFLCSVVTLSLTLSLSLIGNTSESRQQQAGWLSLHIPAMKASISSCWSGHSKSAASSGSGRWSSSMSCGVGSGRAWCRLRKPAPKEKLTHISYIPDIYIYMLYMSYNRYMTDKCLSYDNVCRMTDIYPPQTLWEISIPVTLLFGPMRYLVYDCHIPGMS